MESRDTTKSRNLVLENSGTRSTCLAFIWKDSERVRDLPISHRVSHLIGKKIPQQQQQEQQT